MEKSPGGTREGYKEVWQNDAEGGRHLRTEKTGTLKSQNGGAIKLKELWRNITGVRKDRRRENVQLGF